MQNTEGHKLFPKKQFTESIGRLQFGPFAISKDFDHKNLQNSADFTLTNSSEREFYYKCYGTDIYFKYDLFAKGELFKAFISLEKSRF